MFLSWPKKEPRYFLLKKGCFQNTPKAIKHLVYFCKIICQQELSEIDQSGHTGQSWTNICNFPICKNHSKRSSCSSCRRCRVANEDSVNKFGQSVTVLGNFKTPKSLKLILISTTKEDKTPREHASRQPLSRSPVPSI